MDRDSVFSFPVKWANGEGRYYYILDFLDTEAALSSAERERIELMCRHYYQTVLRRREARGLWLALAVLVGAAIVTAFLKEIL